MSTDHAQSLRLGQRGSAPTPGVQLVAVASLPEVAYRGQIVYALDIDEFRIFDGDAWQIPTAHDTAGLQMFVGATAPVADNIGDFWLKNTTYQIYVWDGAVWREVQDPTADAAAAAAAAAGADALTALGLANDAQATADGKVTTFYQSGEPALPTEDPQTGDIWFRTSDNRAFIYASGAFVEIQDHDIVSAISQAGTAQATADQKISSYYQTTPPWADGASGHGNDIGDLWFDTDDANKCYRWNGNWVSVRDGSIATASAAAATALAAAVAAQSAADFAQATADGAIRTYYQSLAPTGLNSTTDVGDLWFDTDDGQAYRWNGTAFVIIEDNSIAAALAAAMNAQTTADGKITAYYQTTAPTVAEVGDLWYDTDDKNKPYYCSAVGPPAVWTAVRDATIADAQTAANAAQATANAALIAANTDGSAPSTSPDPLSLSGIGFAIIKWPAITNADPVGYQVHISPTLGFTATYNSATTLLGSTSGTQMVVRQLPGAEPAPGDTDPRVLDPDTTYYARIIAYDADGHAAQSAQIPFSVFRVTGIDLAVDSVTAANIVAGTLTGELFSANVIVAGVFRTADSGQRVEFGIAGIKGYKSDGTLMVSFPTAAGEEALFDGEMIARGLTVLGGASLYGDSELNSDSTFVLQRGITQPSATPVIQVTYDTLQPSTTSLSAAAKTNNDPTFGLGGPFDLVPSEVSHIEWRTDSGGYFCLHQQRPNGARMWRFDASGNPVDIFGTGVYFSDLKDWETHATFVLTTSTTPKNGTYVMFRFIPSGTTYYVSGPAGINRYSRQNGAVPPTIGHNGTDMFTAEVLNTDDLTMRFFVPDGSGNNLASPISTFTSTTGYSAGVSLCAATYNSAGFDIGTARYMTAERGNSSNVRLVLTSGSAIYPGGTSNNWASTNLQAETFESPTTNRRGVCWDGTQFWTYAADGFLYKHTSEKWDPVVASSTYWAQQTFYDSVGTTHETLPGVAKSYTAKRRAKNSYTPPTIPMGGVDDPNQIRLYMGRGATQPSNANFHLQYTGSTATTFTTLATATANPPTVNNFPSATAAKIVNNDSTLVIDAAANITSVTNTVSGAVSAGSLAVSGLSALTTMTVSGTATKGGNTIAVEGPYYYATVTSAPGAASGTVTIISGYTLIASSGITVSTGVFTLPRAGRYLLYGQLYWALQSPTPTGDRLAQWLQNGSTVASHTASPSLTSSVVTAARKTIVAAANDTVTFRYRQTAGGSAGPQLTTLDLSYITIDYIGA